MPFFFTAGHTAESPESSRDAALPVSSNGGGGAPSSPTPGHLNGQDEEQSDGSAGIVADDASPGRLLVVSDLGGESAGAADKADERRRSNSSSKVQNAIRAQMSGSVELSDLDVIGGGSSDDVGDKNVSDVDVGNGEAEEVSEIKEAKEVKEVRSAAGTPSAETSAATSPVPTVKKRGRPPGPRTMMPSIGRPVGRPPGSRAPIAVATPVKSRRRLSAPIPVPGAAAAAAVLQAPATAPRRSLKRPAVDEAAPAAETPVAKKRVGRPAKTATTAAPAQAKKTATSSTKTAAVSGRGRGRPKKTAGTAATIAPSTETRKSVRTLTLPKRAAAIAAVKPAAKPAAEPAPKTAKTAKTAKEATSGAKRGRKPAAGKSTPEVYTVEAILDERVDRTTMKKEYLLKWQGFPKSKSTWEPQTHLVGCKKLLRDFEKTKKA
ncbi:chromodomain containing protein [Grosmannia clavigera kw1407]|uniref:Chromodomain containing protein n=1 Tax=Grosmannia clavigera (strain kw1407 / UAMH 11150) TaxID=655863 RepID=F0XDI4_GROCL|nr:chromodomain containing protein [Grosmannia clavigera kw1407]EFX03645.1 chromodomain containing protein [Grosmannia clavigera kw1407]